MGLEACYPALDLRAGNNSPHAVIRAVGEWLVRGSDLHKLDIHASLDRPRRYHEEITDEVPVCRVVGDGLCGGRDACVDYDIECCRASQAGRVEQCGVRWPEDVHGSIQGVDLQGD